jgi:hypothetical protein
LLFFNKGLLAVKDKEENVAVTGVAITFGL